MPTKSSDFLSAISSLVAAEKARGIDARSIATVLATAAADVGAEPRVTTTVLLKAALSTGIRKELRGTVSLALEQASGAAPKELTDLQCRRLKPGGRLSDPQFAGLILVAGKRGKRWVFRSQSGGKQRQVTLGHYPSTGLAEAREKWAVVRAEGLNTHVADARSETTLEALVDEYIDAQKAKGIRTWKRSYRMLTTHLISQHGGMKVGDVTREVLDDLFVPIKNTQPGRARDIRAPISGLFGWAAKENKLPSGMNAPKMTPVEPSKKRDFRPTNTQIRTLLTGIDNIRDGDMIRLQLLTGVRIGEAMGAHWSEIDLAERKWAIPASRMKAKREHVVMLSDQAISILERQKTTEGRVFGARGISQFHKDWGKRRDLLGLPKEYTPHVHRAAMLSWLAENGGGRDIRDRMSAHKPPASADDNYQLSELNRPAAEWWQKWADHVTSLEVENVVELSERRA